jgi:hypothetical protein
VSISGMVVKGKIAGAPRRGWRMTAENQLGQILELAPVHGPGDKRGRHGLRVHDVTDKIPTRMFNALFSPDPGGRSPSTEERS